jgi:cytochrome bd ubiquinol oxidase subunit I
MILASLVDASRMQFALTAMFHWIFVPLTLGLGFIVAFMETKYYCFAKHDGAELSAEALFWRRMARFWSTIFAINFAIGVATGIILEFEFGTNWSNYSWFVGDIFGAPLAIEGIFAFFMESTFFAVMYFGWDKVSKKFHLAATWLTAIGANVSAIWILTANAWMQHPVGMRFNPETARSEMVDFWQIVFYPVAMSKLSHTVTSAFMLASVVVIGISCWYLLKKREGDFAKKSIKVAAVFGLISSILLASSGDKSAYTIAKTQPMKLAAMEGLYRGGNGAPLSAIGLLDCSKKFDDTKDPFLFNIKIPKMLSLMANRESDSFVPGIYDIIEGGYKYKDINGNEKTALSFEERVINGRVAIKALELYKVSKGMGDTAKTAAVGKVLQDNFENFGYGYLNKPEQIVPHVGLCYYSFRIMVTLGGYFILFFIIFLLLLRADKRGGKPFEQRRVWLWIAIISVPLVYICSQCGWIVAEVGRQPWTIQNLLPVQASVSGVSSSNVYTTLIIFFVLFTSLLIAELMIMFSQIRKGPEQSNKL